MIDSVRGDGDAHHVLGAVALTLAAPAAAQQPPDQQEIIVQAERDRDRQIRNFVEAMTEGPVRGQLGRFEDPICPVALGFVDAQADAIAERIRAIAKAANVPVAKAKCEPNIFVVGAPDKEAFVKGLHARYPAFFDDMMRFQAYRIARTPGAAAVWHIKGLLTANGLEALRPAANGFFISENKYIQSLITVPARPRFMTAFVVVQRDAFSRLSLTQLADYAAMRAFTSSDPAHLPAAAPTILKAVDAPAGSAVPLTLTNWDLAFLKALYSTSPNQYVQFERNELRERIAKHLKQVLGEEGNRSGGLRSL